MAERILILGGTTEGRELASQLARAPGVEVEVSLAGRTESIRDQGAPLRVGGFGGAGGLADYLRSRAVSVLIDATHPFAAIMSEHAVAAARATGVAFVALRRPVWERTPGDRWLELDDIDALVERLADEAVAAMRVFLALGRKEVHGFARAPRHAYLVRSVDPVVPPLELSDVHYIVSRGPFELAAERALLQRHRIELVVSRNSGGDAAYAKIQAARELGLPVWMVRRPSLPGAPTVATPEEALSWLAHRATRRSAVAGAAPGSEVEAETGSPCDVTLRGV